MKKMFEKFNRRNAIFAFGVLGFIAIVAILVGGWMPLAGIVVAMPLAVALTDKETAFVAHLKGELQKDFEKFEKGYLTKTKFEETITEKINKAIGEGFVKKEDITELEAAIEKHGLSILAMEKSAENKPTSILEQIEANKEGLNKACNKAVKEYDFVVKANTSRASVVNSTQAMRLTDIGQLAHRKLVMRDLFTIITVGPDSNGVIRYADWDEATTVRAAAMVAEGASFPQSEAKWEELHIDLKKIGDSIPVTEEMIQDAPRFAGELQSFLETNVAIVEDTQLAIGDGTGQNLIGVYTSAPEYVAAAAGISDASIYDLLVNMAEKISEPYGGKYVTDFALMNIKDINKMKLKKDQNDNYVTPPFVTNGGQVVDGIVIIESNAITADTLVVGDKRFAKLYEIEGFNVSTGYTGDQFTDDLMTLKAKKREALLVRNVDLTGFLKETGIAAALITLGS